MWGCDGNEGKMRSLKERLAVGGATAVVVILIFILGLAVSWAFVCFLVWLVCLCFGLEYSLLVGIGVWLVCIGARWVLTAARGNDK
jgi:hypothetical protein